MSTSNLAVPRAQSSDGVSAGEHIHALNNSLNFKPPFEQPVSGQSELSSLEQTFSSPQEDSHESTYRSSISHASGLSDNAVPRNRRRGTLPSVTFNFLDDQQIAPQVGDNYTEPLSQRRNERMSLSHPPSLSLPWSFANDRPGGLEAENSHDLDGTAGDVVFREENSLRAPETDFSTENQPSGAFGHQAAYNDAQAPSAEADFENTLAALPPPDLATVRRRVRRVFRLSEQTLLSYYDVAHKQSAFDSCCGYLEQSTNELMAEVARYRSDETSPSSSATLQEKYDAVQQDRMTLQSTSAELSSANQKLSTLQHKLNTETGKLRSSLSLLSDTVLPPFDIVENTSTTSSPYTKSPSGSRTASPIPSPPSLVAEWYDKKADKRIILERAHDLKTLYLEERERREFIKDQDETPSVTSADLNAKFTSELQLLRSALKTTQTDVRRLTKACLDAGFEPEGIRSEGTSEHLSSIHTTSESRPVTQPTTYSLEHPPESALPHDKIWGWLPKVDFPSAPEGGGASVFETRVQDQRSIAAKSWYSKQRMTEKWSMFVKPTKGPPRPCSCPPYIETAEISHDWDMVSSLQE